jgi:hypothetical protein
VSQLPSPPPWYHKEIKIDGYPTYTPLNFYYRDVLECVQYLFGNPKFRDSMIYSPYRLFEDQEKKIQIYDEIMSGDWAWNIQVFRGYCMPAHCS